MARSIPFWLKSGRSTSGGALPTVGSNRPDQATVALLRPKGTLFHAKTVYTGLLRASKLG